MELPVDVIQRAWRRLVADRRPHGLATDHALQAKARHQPLDCAAGEREAFSPELPPDLPRAVDAEVLREDPLNLDRECGVPPRTGRTPAGVDPLGDMRMVGRRAIGKLILLVLDMYLPRDIGVWSLAQVATAPAGLARQEGQQRRMKHAPRVLCRTSRG